MLRKYLFFAIALILFIGSSKKMLAISDVQADFEINKYRPLVNETIVFTDESYSGGTTIISWNWDFGDGAVPATANTKGPHSVYYTSPGQKTISLQVSDGGSSDIDYEYVGVLTPAVRLPHTFANSSGTIDVNNDGEIDFEIRYNDHNQNTLAASSPGSEYNYSIYGINRGNMVFVEYDGEPILAPQGNNALTFTGATYVSILPKDTEIECPDLHSFDVQALQSDALQGNIDAPFWSDWGNILGTAFILPGDALQATTAGGARDGYFGVYYYVTSSDSYFTGWLRYQYAGSGSFQILSAGSAPTSGAPVFAGAGDPFASPVVPVSIIGSLMALLAIGGRTYFRRKKKK